MDAENNLAWLLLSKPGRKQKAGRRGGEKMNPEGLIGEVFIL
jgi:hypothetical protein